MHDPQPAISAIITKLEIATNQGKSVQLTDRELYELHQYVKHADALRALAQECSVQLLAAANAVGPT